MWVWIWMLLSIILLWVLIPDALGKKKKNLIFLGLSFLVVAFIVGSRSPQLMRSIDMRNYYRMFMRASTMSFDSLVAKYDTIEKGFLFLMKAVSVVSSWPLTFQYVHAAFCTFVMFWYIYRNADNVFFGVITYICLGPWQFLLTGYRQGIAMCLCIIALECMKKRTLRWDLTAAGLILIAMTMHVTAWIFFAAFAIRYVKITKKVLIYATIIVLILFVFIDDIVAMGSNMVDTEYGLSYTGNTFGGLVPIVIYLGALLLTYFIWTWDKTYLDKYGFEVALLVFGLCLYVMRYSSLVMERISMYFTPVICVVLANAISRQKGQGLFKRILPMLFVSLCFILFVYRSFAQYGEYFFYWEYFERVVNI